MSNRIFTIGLPITLLFLGTITSSALAQSVQPEDGFLEQDPAKFMDAASIPTPLYPTLVQEVRAANLQLHLIDTLEIGSPEYKNAHRLLLSNLRMLERQLYFNPVDLARFNSTTHPARSTIDQTLYSPDFPKTPVNTSAATFIDAEVASVAFASNGYSRSYVGSAPTRRSIIVAAEERHALNLLNAL
ncbi:MAG: hypothetical protein Q7S29_01915 [Candidatus Peribacter sp.]|nr:hypothetical protein [Candidatus Peribacter sp.]